MQIINRHKMKIALFCGDAEVMKALVANKLVINLDLDFCYVEDCYKV